MKLALTEYNHQNNLKVIRHFITCIYSLTFIEVVITSIFSL